MLLKRLRLRVQQAPRRTLRGCMALMDRVPEDRSVLSEDIAQDLDVVVRVLAWCWDEREPRLRAEANKSHNERSHANIIPLTGMDY